MIKLRWLHATEDYHKKKGEYNVMYTMICFIWTKADVNFILLVLVSLAWPSPLFCSWSFSSYWNCCHMFGSRSLQSKKNKVNCNPNLLSSSSQIYIDAQEIILKATFSTNYILENKDQLENIKNIDDLTDQVSHVDDSLFSLFLSFSCS
jgi:hypothetical protein